MKKVNIRAFAQAWIHFNTSFVPEICALVIIMLRFCATASTVVYCAPCGMADANNLSGLLWGEAAF